MPDREGGRVLPSLLACINMQDDRRRAPRTNVFLAAEIETPDGRFRSAVSRDASEQGLLLLTRSDVAVGAEIKLHVLRLDQNAAPIVVRGRVVRSEPLDADEALVWLRKLGIALEEPPTELHDEIERFVERQRAFYHK